MIERHAIALILHDSDFSTTIRETLESVKRLCDLAIINDDDSFYLKSDLIIKDLLISHYIAYQNKYKHKNNSVTFEEHFAFIDKYLREGIEIVYDMDACNMMKRTYYDCAYILDISSGEITPL